MSIKIRAQSFFSSRGGQILISISFFIIGLIINAIIQDSSNNDASAIIRELLSSNASLSQLPEKIVSIIGRLYSPFSLQSLIYACLFTFLGFTVSNILFQSGKFHETNLTNDGIIVDLLEHLIEDCFGKCSNTDCYEGCPKFASECDGLLRRYLYEESQQLRTSIIRSRSGEYALDSNIERFHTIAIDHLIAARSKRYAVVHWIGSKPYSSTNKYQETYDRLDFHFLNVLLEKLTAVAGGKQPYIRSKLTRNGTFKIKWLLIGDMCCMKNNFDYIFYVIKSMALERMVKEFFEFYLIPETGYRTITAPFLATTGQFCQRLLSIDNEPSFGVFGENFMFADSAEPDHHGSIYARGYNPNNESFDVLTSVNKFFTMIVSNPCTKKLEVDLLYECYDDIIENEPSWEQHLESIWNPGHD